MMHVQFWDQVFMAASAHTCLEATATQPQRTAN